MNVTVRPLTEHDRAALDALLAADPDATVFLRSNLYEVGMVADGRMYSAHYAGAFEDETLVAVGAHLWRENLLLYAPRHAGAVTDEAVRNSGRPLVGLMGPDRHVRQALAELDLTSRPTWLDSHEILYGLALDDLRVPAPLQDNRWSVRLAEAGDVDQLAAWRIAYAAEALGQRPAANAMESTSAKIRAMLHDKRTWILLHGDQRVAMSSFNARLPDLVQIGGVFTPPALRARGYGRGVVSGSLLGVRSAGVTRSVLFTDEENVAAQRAYEALGYERVGDYGIVFFDD